MQPVSLDYHTLFLASGLIAATLLAFHTIQARKLYPGFVRIVVAVDLLTAAIIAADLRGYISDAIWGVQVASLMAFAWIDSGIRLYCESPRRGHWPFVYVMAAVLLQTCLFFTQPLHVRIFFNSLLLIPIFVDASSPLLRTPPEGCKFGYRFTAVVLMLGCLAACVRMVAIFHLLEHPAPYFTAHPWNTLYFFLLMFVLVALSFGFIALTHERLVWELEKESAERERSEERSRLLSEHLLLALEASQSGTFEWRIKEDLHIWGPMVGELYGYEPGTFPGTYEAWRERIHSDDVAQLEESIKESLKTGINRQEFRVRRKNDGQIRWMLSNARVHFDQEGKPERMVGINLDITEQKNDEEKIRISEQRYRSLVKASSQLVWTLDADGHLRRENQDWLRFTGQSWEESRGLGWSNAIHPEDRTKQVAAWHKALETKSFFALEYRLRNKDGMYRYMHVRAAPVLDDEGHVIEWVGMNLDITEQRLAEKRLRKNEMLAVAGRLALNISHEINNPLAAVTNLVYLIGGDPGLSQATREFVESAERELARVSQAVTRNLRFANASWPSADTDLRELTDSVIDSFLVRFETDHISVERDYRTDARLRCEPGQLQVVIANLLGNAHDAMRKGGKLKIRIREARIWNNPGVHGLKLSIADTGAGIPHDLKHKIFEPFFTTKQETGGGLGLWTCNEIVRKHQGQIKFWTSTVPSHSGTVFNIFFPFKRSRSANVEIFKPAA